MDQVRRKLFVKFYDVFCAGGEVLQTMKYLYNLELTQVGSDELL